MIITDIIASADGRYFSTIYRPSSLRRLKTRRRQDEATEINIFYLDINISRYIAYLVSPPHDTRPPMDLIVSIQVDRVEFGRYTELNAM